MSVLPAGTRRWLLSALAGAVLLSACGGGGGGGSRASTSTFRQDFRVLTARYRPVGQQLAQTLLEAASLSNQELASSMATYAAYMENARGSFAALRPPAALAQSMSAYVQLLGRARQDIDTVAAAARASDAAMAKQITVTLIDDLQAANRAKQQLDSAVGLNPATA